MSMTMASLPVPIGKGVFQLIWKDWFVPPAAVQACCCGMGLPLLKAVLLTVMVAGGVPVGVPLGLGGEVGLPPLPSQILPPPQAIKERLLSVSVNKPRTKGVFIRCQEFAVAKNALYKKCGAKAQALREEIACCHMDDDGQDRPPLRRQGVKAMNAKDSHKRGCRLMGRCGVAA